MDPRHIAMLLAMGPETLETTYRGSNSRPMLMKLEMLYLHNFTFFPGKWLTQPERAGFLSMSNPLGRHHRPLRRIVL
jgi:hypothetical protein